MNVQELQLVKKEDLLKSVGEEKVNQIVTRELSLNDDKVLLGDKVFDEPAMQLLGKCCGYPSSFFKKTTSSVRSSIFRDYVKDKDISLKAVERSNRIIKVMEKDSVYIPLNDICEVITGVEKESSYQIVKLDSSSYAISKVTFHKKEVKKDDILQAGMMFKVNYGNGTSIAIGPYILRLVCTNGMLSPVQNLERLECSSREDFQKQLNFHYTKYIDSANIGMETFANSSTKKIDDIGQYIHGWARSTKLSGRYEEQILDLAPSITERNEYEVLNLITSHANTQKPKGWFSLISRAGSRVFENKEVCKCCKRDLQ